MPNTSSTISPSQVIPHCLVSVRDGEWTCAYPCSDFGTQGGDEFDIDVGFEEGGAEFFEEGFDDLFTERVVQVESRVSHRERS